MKRVIVFFVIVLLGVLGMNKINNSLIGNHNYTVGAIILPLVENIKAGTVKNEESLKKIDGVLELECVFRNEDESAERIFASCLRNRYTNEAYTDFMKESLAVIIKHPRTSLNAIMEMFAKTVLGMQGEEARMTAAITAGDTTKIYMEGAPEKELWDKISLDGKEAVNRNVRVRAVGLLLGMWDEKLIFYQPFFWNAIVPTGLTILVLIYGLMKRRWIYMVMGGTVICWVIIVAITAMAPYFMYYMPVYLLGYVLFVAVAIEFYECKKIERRALHEADKA